MRNNSFITPDFSVEDVFLGIRAKNTKTGVAQSIIATEGLHDFITCITDRDNEDSTSYSIEAMNLYNDSIIIGDYASKAIESLTSDIKLVAAVKQRYGIEKLNPYTFSLEDEGAPATKKKNIIKTIFSAIATVFKKLIMTVGNWIRALMNSIKAGLLKRSIQFYETHAKEIPNLLKQYKTEKIKAAVPTKKFTGFSNDKTINTDKINSITEKLESLQSNLATYVDKISAASNIKNKHLAWFSANWPFSKLASANNIFKSLSKDLASALSLGNPDALAFLQKGNTATKISSPAKVASIIVFGSEKVKTTETTIEAFTKMVPLSTMSQDSANAVKSFVKEGEKTAKKLQKAYLSIQKAATTVEKALNKSGGGGVSADLSKSLTAITSVSNATRMINVYMVGMLLNVHKEYLRLVSYCGTIVRLLVKKGGGGKGGSTKEKKFDGKTGKPLKK